MNAVLGIAQGSANIVTGVAGAIASGVYVVGTEGIGVALGGGAGFAMSLGEVAIGGAQIANGFNVLNGGVSSEPRLRPAQRAAMASGEIEATGPGHAEATILNYASQNGYTVQSIGASRPICSNCAGVIQGAGVTATTPLKAWKGVPYK